jgi:hypothetical protein
VGEFKAQGFLAPAMINYLSLLGWNDGTEQEIFKVSREGGGGRQGRWDAEVPCIRWFNN